MPKTKSKQKVYLSEKEKKLLAGLLEEWNRKTDKKSRDNFISAEALPKIQALNMSQYGPDIISTDKVAKLGWENRVQAVFTWFKNNKLYKDRAVFRLERKLPLRRVIGKLKADEIHEMVVADMPDMRKGNKAYPGHFQKALTALMKDLSDDEMEEMEKIRVEWQTAGPPIDVCLKAAKKYSRKGVINAHQLHKEMYVSCITFSFIPEQETGIMGVVCHDYIAELHAKSHGKKFKTFKEWKGDGYGQDMIGYANYVDEQRRENPDGGGPTPSPVNFEQGPRNLPLLPPEAKGVKGAEVAKNAQEIIRAYYLRHYQLATRCESARTPWAVIGEDPSKFFDPLCLPLGFKFQDLSRMGVSVKSLLNHLRERQKELGVNAFQFHHILRNNKLEVAEYLDESTALMDTNDPQVKMKEDKHVVEMDPAPTHTPLKKKTEDVKSSIKGRKAKVSKKEQENAKAAISSNSSKTLIKVTETAIYSGQRPPFPAEDVGSKTPIPLEIARPIDMPTGVPMESKFPMSIPPTTSMLPTMWPHPSTMVFPENTHYPPCPPQLLSYYPQFLAYMFQQGESNFHGVGSHGPRGSAVAGQFANIDPHLLPPGPPPFFTNPDPHQPQFLENHYRTEMVNQQNQSGGFMPLITSAELPIQSTPSKTPKRKRSQGVLDDDYTPSRSTRNRKPSQKMLASREMGYDP